MKAIRGVQQAAKGVGEAFTGGRDLHSLLHSLHATACTVDAYFTDKTYARVLPEELCRWAKSLAGEAHEAHRRLGDRVSSMEKEGVRGAVESSLHAVSSAAGAITGIAILDVGRHIADEIVHLKQALDDILARATRLVAITNAHMLEKMMSGNVFDMSEPWPVAASVSPELTKLEIESVQPRLWVHQVEDGVVVAGDRVKISWETVGQVSLVNVRLKNCMGVETSRGKTVQRFTSENGAQNKSPMEAQIPMDFQPGKYTMAVSDPENLIRGMTFVNVIKPVSVAEIFEPPSGSLSLTWRSPTWTRGHKYHIKWRMNRGKAQIITVSIAIATSSEGPFWALPGASELKFKAPDYDDSGDKENGEKLRESTSPAATTHPTTPSAHRHSNGHPAAEQRAVSIKEEPEDGPVQWGPQPDAANTEWFLDEHVNAPQAGNRLGYSKTMVSSMGTTFTGLFSSAFGSESAKPGTPEKQTPPPPHSSASSAVGSEGDEHNVDLYCIDCQYEWTVPIELEPGRYFFRIAPAGIGGNMRYSSSEQVLRSKHSGWFYVG